MTLRVILVITTFAPALKFTLMKPRKAPSFDFGEASFEKRARFKQMAEKLTHGSTLTITAPERLVTEHFIVVDALKMTIKNHKNERLYD